MKDEKIAEQRSCIECEETIKGRADKKFCSDQCRITFNNRLKGERTNFMRNVNNVLRRNRLILAELNVTGKSKVNGSKLKEKGFDFSYFTSVYTTKEGARYHFCYEQGYLLMDNNWYLLVVKKDA